VGSTFRAALAGSINLPPQQNLCIRARRPGGALAIEDARRVKSPKTDPSGDEVIGRFATCWDDAVVVNLAEA